MSLQTVRLVHATTLAINGKAVVIRGEPGSGKSSLALQLMETSGNGLGREALSVHLVADDQTELHLEAGQVIASVPGPIRSLIEVRGIGLVTVTPQDAAPVVLVVDLLNWKQSERLPVADAMFVHLLGCRIARVCIDPAEASAASRVRLAWRLVMAGNWPPAPPAQHDKEAVARKRPPA